MLAAILEFLIAVGMLMVHFQSMRRQVMESEADLRRAQSIAQIGSWRFDLAAGTVIPSEEARRIYGLGTGEWSIQQVQTEGLLLNRWCVRHGPVSANPEDGGDRKPGRRGENHSAGYPGDRMHRIQRADQPGQRRGPGHRRVSSELVNPH
jgi:hypothetical protein